MLHSDWLDFDHLTNEVCEDWLNMLTEKKICLVGQGIMQYTYVTVS